MLTTDLALIYDDDFYDIVVNFANDLNALDRQFEAIWDKLTTSGGTFAKNGFCIDASELDLDLSDMPRRKKDYKRRGRQGNRRRNKGSRSRSKDDEKQGGYKSKQAGGYSAQDEPVNVVSFNSEHVSATGVKGTDYSWYIVIES